MIVVSMNGGIVRGLRVRACAVALCLLGIVVLLPGCGGGGSSSAVAGKKDTSTQTTRTATPASAKAKSEKENADFRFFEAGGGYVATREYAFKHGSTPLGFAESVTEIGIEDIERMTAKGDQAEAEEIVHDILASGWLPRALASKFRREAEDMLGGPVS